MKTKREVDRRFRKGIPLKRIWYYRQLGMSFSEIGRLCGCSKQSCHTRLKKFEGNKAVHDELSKRWMQEILEKSSSACRLP
jgi:hypothetical protein